MQTHIVLVDCSDRKGLVYAITGVLYKHNFNIVSNHEFVDHEANHFFMRTEFSGELECDAILNELAAVLPADAKVRLVEQRRRDIVVLVTKEPHCLGDLLIRHAYNELNAQIVAVVSNYPTLRQLVQKFDLPFHYISHEGCTRAEHEAAILDVLARYNPEYLVLAKYMRVLTPNFISHYQHRIINIHHSFLPAFIGARPYHQAFQRGVKIIGATAHVVTEDLDDGPIIAQDVIPVDHTHSPADMAQAGRDVEKIVLARALKLVLEDRIFFSANRTIIFD